MGGPGQPGARRRPRPPAAPRNGPSPCGDAAETAAAHRIELLLAAGDLDAAVAVAHRARSLGLAVLTSAAGATARESVSDTVLAAVRHAVDRRPPGTTPTPPRAVKAAVDTLALARELGIDPDLDRAQELVYDTVRTTDRPDLAPLAVGLGLSPGLFEPDPKPNAPPKPSTGRSVSTNTLAACRGSQPVLRPGPSVGDG